MIGKLPPDGDGCADGARLYPRTGCRWRGANEDIFSQAAAIVIHEATGGVPRLVNQLCDLAMVYAFTKNQRGVIR